MQARVNTHMPFGGKVRKPGDVITTEEWMAFEEAPRRALVSQGHVTLIGDDGRMTGEDGGHDPVLVALCERMDNVEAKLDRLLAMGGRKPAKRKVKRSRKAPAVQTEQE